MPAALVEACEQAVDYPEQRVGLSAPVGQIRQYLLMAWTEALERLPGEVRAATSPSRKEAPMPSEPMSDERLQAIRAGAETIITQRWWPVRVDAALAQELRESYDLPADESDDVVLEQYGYGSCEFRAPGLWDHTGDAMEDYEPLAECALDIHEWIGELLAEVDRLKRKAGEA